ncbi:vasotab-like [Bacillus rossius redtenbacheri]|uniref:vasotab-like n=1 Tax=Bacillus rossius redtenbacheri TaxID=93214 RepID=UPI002FDCD46A
MLGVTVLLLAASFLATPEAVPLGRRPCDFVCPYNYDPVCAVNAWGYRETFPNHCTLVLHNCQNPYNQYYFLYRGECYPRRIY